MGSPQGLPDLMQGLPRPIGTGQGMSMANKVSSSLYVRRAKATMKSAVSWGHALQLQKQANAVHGTRQYEPLQRQAEAAAENFLQMDERITYLTLRIYWESGRALNDPDATPPDEFVIQLGQERDRRREARRVYWDAEAPPIDQLPISKRNRARMARLNEPEKPKWWVLAPEVAKAKSDERAIAQAKKDEIKATRAELRKIKREKTAPARAEARRLKAVERSREWRANQKAKAVSHE